jgi:hypothetical protein
MTYTFVNILDDAMYNGISLVIVTKERGIISGVPHSIDDFESDEDRFGYYIRVGEHDLTTAYIDEIESIMIGELVINCRLSDNRAERHTA